MQFKLHTPTKRTSRACTRAVQAAHANKINISCMHACSSSCTRQQNKRLVHARVQFPMVIRHRFVVRTRKMLWAFLKTCQAVQLLHACVVKFKVSGTVYVRMYVWYVCLHNLLSYLRMYVYSCTTCCIGRMYHRLLP